MNPAKKCAILLGIIKENNAKTVLDYLTKSEKDKIYNQIDKKESFSKKEKNRVLLDFNHYFKTKQKPLISLELLTLIFIFLIIALSVFLAFAVKDFNRNTLSKTFTRFNNTGVIYVILYPFLSYFSRNYYGKSPFRLIFKGKNIFYNVFTGLAGACALFFILVIINRLVDSYSLQSKNYFYALILTRGVFAPAAEEIFFRRFLFVRMSADTNEYIAFFVVNLLFAGVHLPINFSVFFLYFFSSSILTGIYIWRKSLLSCFIAHSFANLVFFLAGNL